MTKFIISPENLERLITKALNSDVDMSVKRKDSNLTVRIYKAWSYSKLIFSLSPADGTNLLVELVDKNIALLHKPFQGSIMESFKKLVIECDGQPCITAPRA